MIDDPAYRQAEETTPGSGGFAANPSARRSQEWRQSSTFGAISSKPPGLRWRQQMRQLRVGRLLGLAGFIPAMVALGARGPAEARLELASQEIAVHLADYAAMPVTGAADGQGNNAGALARINVLREEPASFHRFFVNDLTGPLYILDRTSKQAARYLDLNGRPPHTGLFRRFTFETGLASGFISFAFDPDYANNGRFYTIHLEDVDARVPPIPDATSVPQLRLPGYMSTAPVPTPGADLHEAVLVEWTDTDTSNTAFEGTARELLRVPAGSRFHPMGDLAFNTAARPGDPDWRVMYIACGDGAAGEQTTPLRLNPQRLDTVAGKILRIIPDLSLRLESSTLSQNGRYRIPRDNPFVAMEGARKEIWAYGLRNPYKLAWDVDPANPSNNHLMASVVGLRSWETVVVIHKGANYGYSEREGRQALLPDNRLAALPEADAIPVRVTDQTTRGTVVPRYPVLEYAHTSEGGDAIAGGFVYRGRAVPGLAGLYVFGDTSTGRLWYANFSEMLAVDGSHPPRVAPHHEPRVRWDHAAGPSDQVAQMSMSLFDVVRAAYHARGGKHTDLPGTAALAPSGRVDVRFGVDGEGEVYLLTKSDGMIRLVTGFGPAR
jgi:Glucose / Sorbosone dehydrogenase